MICGVLLLCVVHCVICAVYDNGCAVCDVLCVMSDNGCAVCDMCYV